MSAIVFVLAQVVEPQAWSLEDFSPYPDMDDAKAFTSREAALEHLREHAKSMTSEASARNYLYEVMEVDSNTFRVIAKRDGEVQHRNEYTLYELALER